MIEIEFCIGIQTCFVPISTVSFLHAGQRYLSREYKRAICELATTVSYRKALSEFNKRFYRTGDSALKHSTFVRDVIACGTDLIKTKRQITKERLIFYGFNPDTCEYTHGELPESLRNHMPKRITVSDKTGVVLFPSDEWDSSKPEEEIPREYLYIHKVPSKTGGSQKHSGEAMDMSDDLDGQKKKGDDKGTKEHSQPDDDTTHYVRKRRGTRIEVAPEEKQQVVDQYVEWRNGQVKNPISKILFRWSVEADSGEVVYISSDADLVKKQCKTHVKGGKPERKGKHDITDEPVNVDHWDIKVEWDDQSYGITGTREDVYRQLLVFLLENGLINRFLVFFTDGESCIFNDIRWYFRHWNYVIYLDYFHMQHKAGQLLSQAIKHIPVNDPRETPEYYKRGPKKGQVKKWPQVYLSVLYGRVVSSALFAGNWKEAILYLRNIDPAHVKDPDALNELIKYIWRKRHYITCTAIRKRVGLPNSSNPSESLNNEYVSDLQKGKGKNWREKGSYAIAALTACRKNGDDLLYFYKDRFSYKRTGQT